MPVTVDITAPNTYRKYKAIAAKVRHLSHLGMTQAEIAEALKTTPKTIRRALVSDRNRRP